MHDSVVPEVQGFGQVRPMLGDEPRGEQTEESSPSSGEDDGTRPHASTMTEQGGGGKRRGVGYRSIVSNRLGRAGRCTRTVFPKFDELKLVPAKFIPTSHILLRSTFKQSPPGFSAQEAPGSTPSPPPGTGAPFVKVTGGEPSQVRV